MGKIRFGIIGGGWRSTFFVTAARQMPETFGVTGVLMRDPAKAKAFSIAHDVKTFLSFDQFAAAAPDFVVVSLPRSVSMDYLRLLIKMGIPVLCETPPAWDVDSLRQLWELSLLHHAKIQVAEQYFARPMIAAKLKAVQQGIIGEPCYANLSVCHGYHGINLIRRFLGVGFENAVISGQSFSMPTTQTCSRAGEYAPDEYVETQAKRDIATLAFQNGKVGLYDFSGEQYRSFIRCNSLRVLGDKGQIQDDTAYYLVPDGSPAISSFTRMDQGINDHIDGFCLRSVSLGEREYYKNPFIPARLGDDELAVAYCLYQMAMWLQGKEPPFYPLEEALQDTYLAICLEKALESKAPVETTPQPWAK